MENPVYKRTFEAASFPPRECAGDFFLDLDTLDQCELRLALPDGDTRIWMRLLAPDDAADLIQLADTRAPQRQSSGPAISRTYGVLLVQLWQ